ncbi:hypothetical protein D3C85_1047740 [compost metagenome]
MPSREKAPAAASATRTMRSLIFCQPDFTSISAPLAIPCAALVATAGLPLVRAEMFFAAPYAVASEIITPLGRDTDIVGFLSRDEKKPARGGLCGVAPQRGGFGPAGHQRGLRWFKNRAVDFKRNAGDGDICPAPNAQHSAGGARREVVVPEPRNRDAKAEADFRIKRCTQQVLAGIRQAI